MRTNRFQENLSHEEDVSNVAYKENSIAVPYENPETKLHKSPIEILSNPEVYDKLHAKSQKVAEKVGEVNHSKPVMDSPESMTMLENTDNPQVLIRDLEAHAKKRFSKRQLKILELAASINLWEKRGITVNDLEKVSYLRDNAEKIIQDSRRAGLLIPLEKRIGKYKQYVLSNYKFVIDKIAKKSERKEIPLNDFVLVLLKLLLHEEYRYHDFVMETSLCYPKEDYDEIDGAVLSEKNKQKTGIIPLSARRSCSYTISPNGTIMLFIECTLEPFELHSYGGVVDFFVTCGQIYSFFHNQTRRRGNAIPNVNEWYLKEFEYNKDLVIEGLEQKCPMVRWTATGIIKLEYLGHLFQIYQKPMPDIGNCLRIEGRHSEKDNKNLIDQVDKIGGHENSLFVTAEEMLEKLQSDHKDDSI